MKEDTPETFSIKSVEFIFRHPWIFLSSVVIIMSLVHAKVSLDPVEYESKAVLSFEIEEEGISDRWAEQKLTRIKKNLVSKILLGDSIRSIVKQVWPDLSEEKDPIEYNELLEMLRGSKDGIRIGEDKKDPANLMELSFRDSDPEICYIVLQATIDAIKTENKRAAEEKIETKLEFLRNQIKFYKGKLNTINKEMTEIKNELVERFPELTEREKDLVAGIDGRREGGLAKQSSVETYVMYDEMLTKLNLELLEAQQKKETLKRHLESGTMAPKIKSSKSPEKDVFIEQYSKAAASKELEIADLMAGGYTKEHPEVRKIRNEMNRLKALTRERMSALRSEGPEFIDENIAKEKVASEIGEVNFQIEAIKSKINLTEESREVSREQLKSREGKESNIYERVERLKELKKENEINEGYYLDIRKQLEGAELRARLEKGKGGFKIDIIEDPSVPLSPVSFEKTKLLMLGFIISLMVGTGLAYFIDSIDNSIRSAKELRELCNVPVLASIDKICTAQEVIMTRVRKNTIIITLIVVVVASRILVKLLAVVF
ncbi:MAG: hypothetical protein NG740_02070 [Omnitrophica bacterium]|nr:hypothetical protein [Candidatus Omnitrophota bacterium]